MKNATINTATFLESKFFSLFRLSFNECYFLCLLIDFVVELASLKALIQSQLRRQCPLMEF